MFGAATRGSKASEAINEFNVNSAGNDFVASVHYKPSMRQFLIEEQKSTGMRKIDKWRVPKQIAIKCGLTESDKCKVDNSDHSFFPSPNNANWDDIEYEVATLEAEHRHRSATAVGPAQSIASRHQASGGRMSAKNRERA
ncbi:hypothetical protein THAOC_12546 [Thalassiosira oceanica]|uniref:Uncharacterized protein n=1 Tax=Thalassiosira oceanica TaxID=159749 RepID=K0SZR2_THAOC|nr:hypothetical protein THAOC_12546 [Thalassiosira oceanica]|eukprot:EJK66531.1 hypothetical protein THAOC_12546 [Thalassiosira oceanica]